MKQRAYIYPLTSRLKTGIDNPYLFLFMNCTEKYIHYLNKSAPSGTGIFDIIKYLHKTDVVFLNWVENLPEKKGGLMQSLFFLLLLRIKKLISIKVVWTLHNKISHSSKGLALKRILFKNLLKRSDLIITHSQEGITFSESLFPGIASRIFYFPHPVNPVNGYRKNGDVIYDILIWGSLAPYKGIDSFLEFLARENALAKYRILIAGKAATSEFFERISRFACDNIVIENQFVNTEKLSKMIHQSRVVLFTYSGGSVLSSGALMDSISHRACIVGPRIGAFKEMGQMDVITTYKDFNELLTMLDNPDQLGKNINSDRMEWFVSSHSWEAFGKALDKQIEEIMKDRGLERENKV